MQRIWNPGEGAEGKQDEGKQDSEDLSLPADVECVPRAPSQQPGQFTSCKIDWLSMDLCRCVAANCELIKEHFSGETLSCNQAHPIHSRETCCSKSLQRNNIVNQLCKVPLYCILRNSISYRNKVWLKSCIVLAFTCIAVTFSSEEVRDAEKPGRTFNQNIYCHFKVTEKHLQAPFLLWAIAYSCSLLNTLMLRYSPVILHSLPSTPLFQIAKTTVRRSQKHMVGSWQSSLFQGQRQC